MATSAGDFVVRRNASNTDTIPNAGSDLLALWDTAVANEGSGITYSAGTFTLGATGKFLVLCSDFSDVATTVNNERLNWKLTLNLAGSELTEGYSTGFIRKAFQHTQQGLPFAAAVIDVATTTGNGDDLQVRLERIDDTVAVGQEPDRTGNSHSGITILKLDDAWNYGLYRSTSAFASPTSDNTPATVPIGTTDQEDSPFTRTTNTVDIATNNLVLALWSLKSEDASPTGRAEYQGRLTLAGAEVPGSRSQTYLRVTDNCDWAGMSCAVLVEPTSGDDLELEIISYELGGDDFEGTLQLIELPAGAEAAIMEATTGDFNTAATNFTWDTLPYIDTDAFTATAGNANIDVDNADDYLAFTSQAVTSLAVTMDRATPMVHFRVNTTDDETAGYLCYGRGSGTAETPAIATGTLLTGLSASDSVYVRNDRQSDDTSAIACDVGAFSLIRLSSLFTAAATVTPATVGTTIAVPTPTHRAASVIEPATVAVTTTVPTPDLTAASVVTPATVAVTTTVPTPDSTAASVVTPSEVAVTTTVPTPTPDIAAAATVTPSEVAVTVTVPTPSLTAAATLEPATVAVVAAVPTPTTGGSGIVSPAVVATVTAVPTPDIAAASTVTPSEVATTITVPTATVLGGAAVTPTTIDMQAEVRQATATAAALVAPSTVAGVIAVPTATIDVELNAFVSPARVVLTIAVPQVTLANFHISLTGGYDIGRFYRNGASKFILVTGIARSGGVGYRTTEGWETVSGRFAVPVNLKAQVVSAVAATWLANTATDSGTLTTLVNADLNAAGYRRPNGSAIT